MRAIFFGTPAIAVPSLETVARLCQVTAVVCQPDRKSGRGLELSAPAVKVRALALGLTVHQPASAKAAEFAQWMRDQKADLGVVLAYGRILPRDVLAAPRLGCVNLHASLLPKYRGAAPIQWAIARGESETGVSLMQMDEGLDTGPVFVTRTTPIGPDETAAELGERLGVIAAELLGEALPKLERGELAAIPQDDQRATLAPILEKQNGAIDWTRPANAIHDHVRGMAPWPGAFTHVEGKLLKVLATRRSSLESTTSAPPGTVVSADARDGVLVACGAGLIEILRGQREGQKAVSGRDLAAGRTLRAGARLG